MFQGSLKILCVLVPLLYEIHASALITKLSENQILVPYDFSGTKISIVGQKQKAGSIIVIVKGARESYKVYKKEKHLGMWLNFKHYDIGQMYKYYAEYCEDDTESISHLLKPLEIGSANIAISGTTDSAASIMEAFDFKDAFFTSKEKQHLFTRSKISVSGPLFEIPIYIPSNIPSGNYIATVYLVKDGSVIAMDIYPFVVKQVGITGNIYSAFMNSPIIYTIISIILSIVLALIIHISSIQICKFLKKGSDIKTGITPNPKKKVSQAIVADEAPKRKRGRPKKL